MPHNAPFAAAAPAAMTDATSHDQNFKNLILDYPRQALEFFAPEEAAGIDDSAVITPIRQEQLKNRLGDRFRVLDVPLKVEWPDGRREALLFLLEEESKPARFSIYRLVSYCAALAEECQTDRVVPIVIFLKSSASIPRELHLGGDNLTFLSFRYIACVLPDIPAEQHKDSPNIVARITLPTQGHKRREQIIDLVAWAMQGLRTLEPDGEKYLKYLDFVHTYGKLTDSERQQLTQRYPEEGKIMTTWSQSLLSQGRQEGRQEGEALSLLRLLTSRFGPLGAPMTERVRQASPAELERWLDNILGARSLKEVFGDD